MPALDASPQFTCPFENLLSVAASTPHQPEAVLEPAARVMGPILSDREVLNPRQVQLGTALRAHLLHRMREGANVYIHLAVSVLK